MRNDNPAILVVDDNPQNLQVVASTLIDQEFDPTMCQGGEQALEWLEDHEPELILLDVSMPKMDGFTLCRLLKNNEQWAHVPVIFLTARTEIEDVLEGFDVGAVDYIAKPFHRRELLARVRLHLELKWAREEIQTLRGILPICSICKKIRDEKGYWERVDWYISQHSATQFSHALCPECMKEKYPRAYERMLRKQVESE